MKTSGASYSILDKEDIIANFIVAVVTVTVLTLFLVAII